MNYYLLRWLKTSCHNIIFFFIFNLALIKTISKITNKKFYRTRPSGKSLKRNNKKNRKKLISQNVFLSCQIFRVDIFFSFRSCIVNFSFLKPIVDKHTSSLRLLPKFWWNVPLFCIKSVFKPAPSWVKAQFVIHHVQCYTHLNLYFV